MSSSGFARGAFDPGCIIDVPRKYCCPLRHTFAVLLNALQLHLARLERKNDQHNGAEIAEFTEKNGTRRKY